MDIELHPNATKEWLLCPFCGGHAQALLPDEESDIHCTECGATADPGIWNTRFFGRQGATATNEPERPA